MANLHKNINTRCWAVVPAAGVGARMGGDRPKQYLPLAGRTVIEQSLDCVLDHPAIEGVVIAISEGDADWTKLHYQHAKPVLLASGGEERCHSVLNALEVLSDTATEDDWVLVHDAARPCLRQEDISHLIDTCKTHDVGGILAVPVKDTMKKAGDFGEIIQTVDRTALWHAQTPQMFRLGVLRKALEQALEKGVLVTDEASAIEWAGLHPLLVEGHADNVKITRPEDLALAEFYLSHKF